MIGFVLEDGSNTIYVTGDTVWYDGVAEVARRFNANVVLLFAGSAQTRGPFHLTMDTNDAIETAQAFPNAVITERRRFAQDVQHAWLRIAPAVAGAWVRHHHRVRHNTS